VPKALRFARTDLNVRFGSDDSGIPNTVRISRDARGDQQILGRVAAIEGGLDHACGLDDFVDGNRPHAAAIKQVTGHSRENPCSCSPSPPILGNRPGQLSTFPLLNRIAEFVAACWR